MKMEPRPALNFFRGLGERFATGSAIAMNRHGGNALGNSGAQRNDARDIRGIRRLRNAAENDFIDERRIEAGASEQGVDRDTTEFLRAFVREVRAGFAKGGANTIHDDETLGIHDSTSSVSIFRTGETPVPLLPGR